MAEITMEIPLRGVMADSRQVHALGEWIAEENNVEADTRGTWEINERLLRYPWSRRSALRAEIQRLIDAETKASGPEKDAVVNDLRQLLAKIEK